MKKWKKVLSITLAAAMLLTSQVGCGSKNDDPTEAPASGNPTETASNSSSSEAPASGNPVDDFSFNYSDGIDENGFFEGVKALDYVEMFNYKSIPIPSEAYQVSDEDVQAKIDEIMSGYASDEQITDRAVADGDRVDIDYVGSVDGVEFNGGSTNGMGMIVTAGSMEFVDDFLVQIIGHNPGETFNVEVTFPDSYQQEPSLQGKDALFVTTINYIVGETVQPELTDDFVAAKLSASYGWGTVAEMKQGISDGLKNAAIQQYINEYMTTKVTILSVPEAITQYQEKSMFKYYRDGAAYYEMDYADFLSTYVGVTTEEELIDINYDSNMQNAIYTLVSQAVAEDGGFTVTDEDMEKYVPGYSDYVGEYGLPYLKQYALILKVLDYIASNAVFE